MAYMYKRNGNWRVLICKNRKRKDINLGEDLGKARIIKSSLEQVTQSDRFKQNLVDTLVELGFLENGLKVSNEEQSVSWDYAKQKLLDYLKNIGRAKKTLYVYDLALNRIKEMLKVKKPSDVTTQKADEWIEALLRLPDSRDKTGKKTLNPAGVNAMVRVAKAAFKKFARWQYVDVNPFFNCEMPKVELSIPRPLSDEELEKLLKASNKPLKRCIKVLVYSGMRPDEFYHLTWKRVIRNKNPYIHITTDGDWHPKAYTQRMIPITNELDEALEKNGSEESLVAGRNEMGFPVNDNWLNRSFKRAVQRAGLYGKKITVYNCRDTYATNLALQGHEAHYIAARLGHRNISTSMRYVSLARLNEASFK